MIIELLSDHHVVVYLRYQPSHIWYCPTFGMSIVS